MSRPLVTRCLRLGAAGLLAFATAAHAAETAPRPRVGLVLGGGGARGAAHIGVLEVLEHLRVPVDCVAGTSMGALVAGTWAAGMSPSQMRIEMSKANWRDMFQDNPALAEMSYRSRELSRRFLPASETGFNHGELTYPPGVVLGQKIKLFFNSLVHASLGEPEMQQLVLPVSIIATDIGTGERVVFRDGSLTMAMRASMSVPGLLAPQEYRGRKLVDGGLVDNLPIREVRERCRAEVVIAVNVGSPLLRPEEVGSLLSVSAQMVNILTEQNVAQSLALLGPGDVYIMPDLDGISAADFDKHEQAAEHGRVAAQAFAARLQTLSVSEDQYAQWWSRFAAPANRQAPRVDEIEIAGLEKVNPAAVKRHVEQREGEPLDTGRLDKDLLRVFGDGWYESVDYTLVKAHDRNVLRIAPVEKSWGPNYLRMGVNLEVSDQGSTFELRAGYQMTWLNRLGGELLVVGQLGSVTGAAIQFNQPLDPAQTFFIEPVVAYDRHTVPLFEYGQKFAEYLIKRGGAEIAAGVNVGLLGRARLGWFEQKFRGSLETGLPVFPTGSVTYGGAFFSVDLEQFDQLYFPSRGWGARLRYASAKELDFSELDFSRLDVALKAAYPFSRNVLSGEFFYTGSPKGRLPFFDASTLGGFLRMSAFAKDQLVGDDVYYAQLRAERILGYLPIGLRGDIRVGLALEAARRGLRYSETQLDGWLNSTTVYLGGETPLGPMYLGYGYSTSGVWNVYLFLGTP